MTIVNYFIGLLIFTLSIWAFELVWIVFAVILKNRRFISFLSVMSSIVTGIYGILLCIGAFIWLVNVTNFIVAVILAFLFGGIIFSIAALPATLANLPFQLLAVWAEEKIPYSSKDKIDEER